MFCLFVVLLQIKHLLVFRVFCFVCRFFLLFVCLFGFCVCDFRVFCLFVVLLELKHLLVLFSACFVCLLFYLN